METVGQKYTVCIGTSKLAERKDFILTHKEMRQQEVSQVVGRDWELKTFVCESVGHVSNASIV